jgi:hypothetical protein
LEKLGPRAEEEERHKRSLTKRKPCGNVMLADFLDDNGPLAVVVPDDDLNFPGKGLTVPERVQNFRQVAGSPGVDFINQFCK